MTYKVYNTIPNGYHNDLVLEDVEQKPIIETVLWFIDHPVTGRVPHVADKSRVARARKGVVNTEFRKKHYEFFKQYYDLTDNDDVPYKHPYTKK